MMDMKTLEQQLYIHCKPIRDWVLVKILDRECLIEESDVCLVMAVGDKTYKNKSGYLVEVNVSKGDRVLIPRKVHILCSPFANSILNYVVFQVRRITAEITTDFFMVSMFDILSFWK